MMLGVTKTASMTLHTAHKISAFVQNLTRQKQKLDAKLQVLTFLNVILFIGFFSIQDSGLETME